MKQIKGFSNYFVDKDGTITTKSGKILKHFSDNYGYSCVSLRKDGKSYTKRVHRLVGETYLKPVKGKNIINHKDGNKKNCHIDNLEYMSNAENTKHGYDNNLYKSKSMLPIVVTDLNGNHIGDYRSIRAVSDQLQVNRKTLSSILNGDRKNSYEYNFSYKEDEEEVNNMNKVASYKELICKEAAFKKKKNNSNNPVDDKILDSDYYKVYDEGGKNTFEYFGENKERAEKAKKSKAHFTEAKEWKERPKTQRSKMKEGIIPSDYSRVKQIELDADDFRTVDLRDMKFYEKIKDNAYRASQNAKTVAGNIKGLPKWKKALLAGAVGTGAVATLGVANEAKQLLKNPDKQKDTRADKSRDKDLKNKIFRDSVNPDFKRHVNIAPSKLALQAALIKPALKANFKGMKAGQNIASKITNNPMAIGLTSGITGAVAGGIVSSPVLLHDAALMSHQEIREMNRLKKRYLGEEITKEEKKEILDDNFGKLNPFKKKKYNDLNSKSVEEKIQEMRRKAKRNGQQYKKASETLDELCKEAKEKWTKEDKKGYLKNVAISAAQDFVNAGNPLNIGSSMVGSVLDSALLEGGAMKLNKQIQRDKIAERKLKGYNKAVEVKNGVAIPHAIDNKVNKSK